MVTKIVPKHGGNDIRFAASPEESAAIWRGRKVSTFSRRVVRSLARQPLIPPGLCFVLEGRSLEHHGPESQGQELVDGRLCASVAASSSSARDAEGSRRMRAYRCYRRTCRGWEFPHWNRAFTPCLSFFRFLADHLLQSFLAIHSSSRTKPST